MSVGRVATSALACLVVAGCAVVAVDMSRSDAGQTPHRTVNGAAAPTPRPAVLSAAADATHATARSHRAASHAASTPAAASTSVAAAPRTPVPTSTPAGSSAPRPSSSPVRSSTSASASHSSTHVVSSTSRPSATRASKGQRLPLGFATHDARKVITVVASSHSSTTATLQAWSKYGNGWVKHGSAVYAHVGTQGLTSHPSESKSATPIGSFTLTRAFGRDSNPGTALPYVHTTPADWWISQPGKLYNTLQVCSSNCSFTQGDPNEHLYYETPYYDYAVVIDYNTRNAPGGVKQGKGSAFFLHVHPDGTGGTAGCVDIPVNRLVSIMRWLTPRSHARILIGVRG